MTYFNDFFPRRKKDPEKRFWTMVIRGDENDCWMWTGALTKGYGQFWGGELYGHTYAHIFSYRIHFDDYNSELKVCHFCDEPRCVNPNHLMLGTQRENLHDAAAKGRLKRPREASLLDNGTQPDNAQERAGPTKAVEQ